MKRKKYRKAENKKINMSYLERRAEALTTNGWPISKWIMFCAELLDDGFEIELYEAKKTVSKYVTVMLDGKRYKVRFSDHKPIKYREVRQDCDFFVGKTNFATTTTQDALVAVRKFFGR